MGLTSNAELYENGGINMEPTIIMDKLSSQILDELKAMSKARSPEDKLTSSKIVKNLCDSLSVFFDLMYGMFPDEEDEPCCEPYDSDNDDKDGIPFKHSD